MSADDNAPLGLHLQLAAVGLSHRFVVWFERYTDGDRFRQPHTRGTRAVPHPGCIANTTPPPVDLPAGCEPTSALVRLPRLGNGFPVALPGLAAHWNARDFRTHDRGTGEQVYTVQGWNLPPEVSLAPLRQFLIDWRQRCGPATMAPHALDVLDVLERALELLRDGPMLPTLGPYLAPRTEPNAPRKRPVKWVPPVSVATLQDMLARMARSPYLPAVDAQGVSSLDVREPDRLAWFLIETFDAAARRSAAPPPEASDALQSALERGDPATVQLHRAHGSCLYPTHRIFQLPEIPTGHLHAIVAGAPDRAMAGDPGFRMEIGLRDEPDAYVPVSRLIHTATLRDSVTEQRDHTWVRPAPVLYRDWRSMARQHPWVFARPELLACGVTDLEPDEANEILGWKKIEATRAEWSEFLEREALTELPRGRRLGPKLTVEAGRGSAVRVRVRWDLVNAPGGEDAASLGLAGALRFTPTVSVTLGDEEMDAQGLEKLLVDSAAVLHVGGATLRREDVQAALDLARAREKVLQRLNAASGLALATVSELEDEWLEKDDDELEESVFGAAWRQVLDSLTGAASVPRIEAPETFHGELRPYQQRGLSWLDFLASRGFGACLADDMGLGKTVQVLALLARRARPEGTVSLVVCPTSVVHNWAVEAKKFVPSLRVHVHQGLRRVRDEAGFAERVNNSDLVVTSYALLRRDEPLFRARRWDLLVADEAQNVKNPAAQQTRVLKSLESKARIALTGTPVENRLRDLWSVFDFADAGLLGGSTRFARTFATPIKAGHDSALERLKRRVGPFLLRRTKRDPGIAADLPPKQEQDVFAELTREQAALYRAMSEAALAGLADKAGIARRAHILAALTHLKQICNHPDNFEPERAGRLFGRSGKLDRLGELLEELLEENQPTLIFTQYARMGEILARAVEERFNVPAPFFHGGLDADERQRMVREFQSDNGPPVFILSLRAGGTGLNLTRATAVIHYDRWWNPAVEDQATDRAHRIGQTRTVNVYRFVTRGTLEERVARMIEEKRDLARQVLADADDSWVTELGDAELRDLLSLGSDAIETVDDEEVAS